MSIKYSETLTDLKKAQDESKLVEIISKLSKMNANFEDKVIEHSEIEKLDNSVLNTLNIEKADSFNNYSTIDEQETKLVIVGTITPWNGKNLGYFYTSGRNKVYRILDDFFNLSGTQDSFVNLKKKLKATNNNSKKADIVNLVKENLKNRKIAFVDVIKTAIREKNNSNDDKIILYSLDLDTFKKCENVEKFICTSKNTASCLTNIFDNLGFNTNKIVVCPQDRFHYKWENWKNELDKVF